MRVLRRTFATFSSRTCGFDAVLHLAGISNDPLESHPRTTYAINHRASVRPRLAKQRA
jgi:hypothetical protein